jgi:NAD(P)-dependent dehydrogenase (short-subunit alcohol dehydrogenase family)
VVTGGANGIGEAIVRRFLQSETRVVIGDLEEEPGRRLESELNQGSRRVVFVKTDVQHEPDCSALIDAATSEFGGLDVLVNNAGIRFYQDVTEASTESWDQILGVNLKGYALCAKAAIPKMRGTGGVIVNIASVRSMIAGPKMVQYDTTKAAILGLTRSMARDHAADGVRVVAVGPGPILTKFHERRAESLGQTLDAYRAEFGSDTMLNRPGTPAEVANAVHFLASDEASFITGTCLFVDGGQTGL